MSTDSVLRHSSPLPALVKTLVYSLATLLLTTSAVASVPAMLEEKTLDRFHDPVIVRGADLAGVPDRRTSRLRLYRFDDGVLSATPFQFDQVDADGEIVIAAKAPASPLSPSSQASDTPPVGPLAEPEFVLDDNDEFVFMAKDTGGRAALGARQLGSDWFVEIEVRDPLSGSRGWVYLMHFPEDPASGSSPPARSNVRYAYFDLERNRVVSSYYELQYAAGYSFFTGMRIRPEAGGSGRDIVNSMKIRVRPTFSLWIARWSPQVSEDDFRIEVKGVRNGPVRSVRRIDQRLELGGLLPVMPTTTLSTYYYFSSFLSPAQVSVPGLALRMLSDLEFAGMTEFAAGSKLAYWDGANLDGIELGPGAVEAATIDRAVVDSDHDWWAVRSPEGSCLHAFILPEDWRQWGVVRGTALADPYASDEAGQGETPGPVVGYSLLNMADMQRGGEWEVQMATLIPKGSYQPGHESQVLNMLLEPLETRVDIRLPQATDEAEQIL